MRTVALSEVTDLIDYGVTASARSEPVGPRFLRITDIQQGDVSWASVPYCEGDARKLRASRLRQGDIVFARTGATTGKSFLIRSCPEDAVFASYLIRIRPSSHMHPEFLAHFFGSRGYWDQITLKAAGAAQPGVNASKLAELEIPLPPLEEQKRIAAILDQADALRRLRARALDRLNALGQAIFHEMFGGGDYQRVHLSDVTRAVDYGLTASASDMAVGPKFLRITDIQDGLVDWETVPRCIASEREVEANKLEVGDIVFARTGATTGKSFLIDELPETSVFASYLIRVKPSEAVIPAFLFQFFQTEDYWRQISGMSAGVAQPGVNSSKLRELMLPIPPLPRQRRFADHMAEIAKYRSSQNRACEQGDSLFSSLQHRAFRGEL